MYMHTRVCVRVRRRARGRGCGTAYEIVFALDLKVDGLVRLVVVDLELGILIQHDDERAIKFLLVVHHNVEFVKACSGSQKTRPAPPATARGVSKESVFVSPGRAKR